MFWSEIPPTMLVAACFLVAAGLELVTGTETPAKDELNVSTNCREYPAYGVTDPLTCSRVKQDGSFNYNPVVGDSWQNSGCPAGWASNQGSCYKLVVPVTSMDLAAADCGAQSAHLATVLNMETNLFIKNLLASSGANNIFIGGRSDGRGSMKWMAGGNIPITTDFSNQGNTFENNLKTVAPGKCLAMVKGRDEWEIVDCNTAKNSYICQKPQPSSNVGFCRWDAFRANTDVKSACMCPTSMNTCSKRPNCYWYEDPNSPFKECISNSERFYNMLHRLLARRGKKDFALNIRYGATPARGQMPFGPYGPAVIGAGNPNPTSMFGVYGHKNPYDQMFGMGMFGMGGHYGPRSRASTDPWGQSFPGWSQGGYGRGGQWGKRNQVYHEGNRFNPYRQQSHRQY